MLLARLNVLLVPAGVAWATWRLYSVRASHSLIWQCTQAFFNAQSGACRRIDIIG